MDNPGEIAGHIGTPLTSNATKVLLLGSGELGKQLASGLLPALQGEDVAIADPMTREILAQLKS